MIADVLIKGIGDSIKGVMDSLDNLLTSKDERMQKDNELAEIRNELAGIQKEIYETAANVETELIKAKSSAIAGEVSGNKLQRSWRPLLMLCFGGIIIYQYFLVHFINVIFTAFSIQFNGQLLYIPEFDLPDRFWSLLEIGVGGYIAGRSLEKLAPNVAEKIVDAKESRRMTEELKMKQEERIQRREHRQERWEQRQERKEERMEVQEAKLETITELVSEGTELSRKQERQKKRLERKLRCKETIKDLFN